jgi:catechol 2,3-dioxygenase-like lactoylglutathione lyase family enzyme
MAKVLGIGGVFFKAQDPEAVRDWYRRVLDIDVQDWGGAVWPHPDRGYVNWSVHKADTDYYNPSTAPFMVNFMVDDLDGVLAKASAVGVEPVGRDDTEEFGKFAWLMDPAGVKIELWEPGGTSPFP